MTTATLSTPPQTPVPAASAQPYGGMDRLRRLTVAEYHEMIRHGIVKEGEPVELLEGLLVTKMSRNPPHEDSSDRIEGALLALLPAEWFLRSQRVVTLIDGEPEPDFAIVRGPRGRYRGSHPAPADVGLLIEVADSSRVTDRIDKARMYARSGVVAYWVVNLIDRRIEVFTLPDPDAAPPAYRQVEHFAAGTAVPLVLDGVPVGSVAVSDVIP